MSVFFFWVHGEWIVARDKQIAWTAKRFSADLFVPRYDSFPMNPEKKRHSFLIFTMLPTKDPFYNSQRKIINSKFPQLRALNFIWCNNYCAVIRSNCRTFCWLCSSGNELKNFSRVQRRKYVTIVNITLYFCFLQERTNLHTNQHACRLPYMRSYSGTGWNKRSFLNFMKS